MLMIDPLTIGIGICAATSFMLLVLMILSLGSKKGDGDLGASTTTAATSLTASPANGEEESFKRFIQAGFYRKRDTRWFVLGRSIACLVPFFVAGLMGWFGAAPPRVCLIAAVITSVLGSIAPSFWLDARKRKRQFALRRSLPDAIDVIVLSMEAGLSMQAALNRASSELSDAHPLLAQEFRLCQKEIQMGSLLGESLNRLSLRFDIDELRGLASAVTQSERFGTSMIGTLQLYAESLRTKRYQIAEERAGKASIQLVFPTMIFIFPALFVVLAGPAVMSIFEMLRELN